MDHPQIAFAAALIAKVLQILVSTFTLPLFPPSLSSPSLSPQPLESISWQHEGQKFVTAHSDSSIYYWSTSSSIAHEGPTQYYAGGTLFT